MAWPCTYCTYENMVDHLVCAMCLKERALVSAAEPSKPKFVDVAASNAAVPPPSKVNNRSHQHASGSKNKSTKPMIDLKMLNESDRVVDGPYHLVIKRVQGRLTPQEIAQTLVREFEPFEIKCIAVQPTASHFMTPENRGSKEMKIFIEFRPAKGLVEMMRAHLGYCDAKFTKLNELGTLADAITHETFTTPYFPNLSSKIVGGKELCPFFTSVCHSRGRNPKECHYAHEPELWTTLAAAGPASPKLSASHGSGKSVAQNSPREQQPQDQQQTSEEHQKSTPLPTEKGSKRGHPQQQHAQQSKSPGQKKGGSSQTSPKAPAKSAAPTSSINLGHDIGKDQTRTAVETNESVKAAEAMKEKRNVVLSDVSQSGLHKQPAKPVGQSDVNADVKNKRCCCDGCGIDRPGVFYSQTLQVGAPNYCRLCVEKGVPKSECSKCLLLRYTSELSSDQRICSECLKEENEGSATESKKRSKGPHHVRIEFDPGTVLSKNEITLLLEANVANVDHIEVLRRDYTKTPIGFKVTIKNWDYNLMSGLIRSIVPPTGVRIIIDDIPVQARVEELYSLVPKVLSMAEFQALEQFHRQSRPPMQ